MSLSDSCEVPAKRFKPDDMGLDSLTDERESAELDHRTRQIVDEEWMTKLKELLLCPVCYETIRPSVSVCLRGHSVCSKCRGKLFKCPVCKGRFSETENLMLSNIADLVKYSCLNAGEGCDEMYYLRDEAKHLTQCKCTVYRCKINECNWSGSRNILETHMDVLHKGLIERKDWFFTEVVRFKNYPVYSYGCRKLLVIHNELFWHFSKSDHVKQKLYINFRYVGSKEMASNFVYQLCLSSSDENMKFLLKMAMDEDTNTVNWFDSSNCACIDFDTLKLFGTEQELEVHFFITKLS